MLQLFCDRPHVKTVDFVNSRFIVSKACGLDVNGQHLEMGDELPGGVLNEYALREIYEPPLSLIEVFEHAVKDPALLAACLRRDAVRTPVACVICGGCSGECECSGENEPPDEVFEFEKDKPEPAQNEDARRDHARRKEKKHR